MDIKKILPIIIAFFVGGAAAYLALQYVPRDTETVQEPETEEIEKAPVAKEEENDLLKLHYTRTTPAEIDITSPRPGDVITSPLTITGNAVGGWYFEANAPVTLTNWDGLIIAEGYVMATDNWMTADKVPFEGTLVFEKPIYGDIGFLILQNDNPSGLPEYSKAVEIPIRFE